jgi:hypothetical protein
MSINTPFGGTPGKTYVRDNEVLCMACITSNKVSKEDRKRGYVVCQCGKTIKVARESGAA